MGDVIHFLLSNFTLTLLVLGILVSAVSLLRTPRPLTAPALVEALFSYFILFSIAINYFYNFVEHVFFSEATARFIGWADSPFQGGWLREPGLRDHRATC